MSVTDTLPHTGDRSILFICKRAIDDPIVTQVSCELDQAIVRAPTQSAGLEQARTGDFPLILVGYAGDAEGILETIRAVRANPRSSRTPIVALGLPQPLPFPQEYLYDAGAIAVLTEPLSPTILRAKARFYTEAFDSQVERRRAETELEQTRSRLERIVEAAELGIWSWDIVADRLRADARMAALFGVPRERRLDAPLATYLAAFHPDDIAPTIALINSAIDGGGAYAATYRIRAAAGGWRWMIARGHVEYDDDGAPCEVHGVVMDATRQREAEQQLRATEERYRTVFDSIDEGLCVIDMIYDGDGQPCDYLFVEANPAFVKHTGLVDAVGKTIRQLVPTHEQHWFEIYGRVAQTGEAVRFENEARGLDRWYDVHATRLGPPELRRVAVLFTDITERRRSEAALRRMAADLSEANRLKTEFLATLAHELRNPLAPIRSGLQFIRRSPDDREAVGRVHGIMERQLDHLVNLVDDLLDVARITRGQVELRRERVDLATVLAAAVETSMPLIEAARHGFELRLPDEALVLEADPTRLTQVVSNLLNNAARYTPKGGRIALEARRDGEQAVVTVTDNGIGIAPEALEDVFRMFTQVGQAQQAGSGGLGIGLSLVRSLVELHGGSVSAASAGVNAGSAFTIRLPLVADAALPALEAGATGTALEAAPPGRSVLVVDDNRDAADTLAALLNMMGHRAPVANDGRQALRMLPSLMPDVVFLDLGMPGMSGYEVAAAIRQDARLAGIRLVALTGWGGEADRARTRAAGFDEHLTKPATVEAIEQVLRRS
ncbi:PAS domain S-box-containing protein [Massilia sp. UYP11]|uniref:hybrid sensor histidine kinase/response regulator n=1 Tax=Massilia sp. UYP11 TaxID=1756385 RepID=UPI003D253349